MLLGLSTGHDMLLKAREQRHQQLLDKDDLSLIKDSGVDVVVIDLDVISIRVAACLNAGGLFHCSPPMGRTLRPFCFNLPS